jgi:hypothetical protein
MCFLFYPSAHLYNGLPAEAEFVIVHFPEKGGPPLYVYIPIKISDQVTGATKVISEIINDVSTTAPSQGKQVNIGGFNLKQIVPKKPFINYNLNGVNNVVFGLIDAIPISKTTMDTFKSVILPNTWKITGDVGLFYNSSGPNTTTDLGDGIYISCNPTGSSEEQVEVTYDKNEMEPLTFDTMFEDPIISTIIKLIVACAVFLVIFYAWSSLYKVIDGEFGVSKIGGT